ncbi:MAG: MarR family transcriptional regulator [Hyphomicrobiales bacterium]|jgi:DNA-binding MarR family transcriptional regulator|nr:MarR family transcriptional regulator [Hyphomicrobiales bacterium]
MAAELKQSQSLRLLHDVSLDLVRECKPDDAADFTLRQLTILLTVYLEQPPHTVRGLAAKLAVTKPVITRALDSLGKLGILTRKRDPADKRNVIIQRTVKGALYVESLGDLVIRKMRALQ